MRMARTVRPFAACALAVAVVLPAAAQDVGELERRVERLENIIDSGQLARLIQQINSLEEEIRDLRGEIETQAHRIDELRQRQRNLYADMDRRMRALEVAGTGADAGAAGSATAGAEGADAASAAEEAARAAAEDTVGDQDAGQARSEDEREAYDAAFELLKDGRYDEAAGAFAQFVERHPEGPYADNAQYWLAESRYVTRDFEAALEAFRAVTEKYPDSAKVADARLKIGYTLYELGRHDEARSALQRVVEQHPNSAVSRLAEERLLKIRREQD